jgi:hypothetical protein
MGIFDFSLSFDDFTLGISLIFALFSWSRSSNRFSSVCRKKNFTNKLSSMSLDQDQREKADKRC